MSVRWRSAQAEFLGDIMLRLDPDGLVAKTEMESGGLTFYVQVKFGWAPEDSVWGSITTREVNQARFVRVLLDEKIRAMKEAKGKVEKRMKRRAKAAG